MSNSSKKITKNQWFVNDKESDNNFWTFINNPKNRKAFWSLEDISELLGISAFSAYLSKCSALKKIKAALEAKVNKNTDNLI